MNASNAAAAADPSAVFRSSWFSYSEYASFVVNATTFSALSIRPSGGTWTGPVASKSVCKTNGSARTTPSSVSVVPFSYSRSIATAAEGKSGVMLMFCQKPAPPNRS
jgi:hypothetical protein